MTAAFAFLCALVGLLAGVLTGNAALTTLAFWVLLIAFGALLPFRQPTVVVVVTSSRDPEIEALRALPTAAPGSYPDEEM